MKRILQMSVQTLVLLGVVVIAALGIMATTSSSAQTADDAAIVRSLTHGEPWVLQPRRCIVGDSEQPCYDSAYLLNIRAGELFQIVNSEKYLLDLRDLSSDLSRGVESNSGYSPESERRSAGFPDNTSEYPGNWTLRSIVLIFAT